MPNWGGSDSGEDDTEYQAVPESPYKRELRASKIYSYNDAEVAQVIASVLHKMTCSPRVPIKLLVYSPSYYQHYKTNMLFSGPNKLHSSAGGFVGLEHAPTGLNS